MPPISDPSRPDRQTSCTVRDQRVATALASLDRHGFAPLDPTWRNLADDALVRVIEDLNVRSDARVLVVEPHSGRLPVVLAKLARQVTVVCSHPVRASMLSDQITKTGVRNVRLTTFLQDREDDQQAAFDRIVVLQPANEELGPVMQGLLASQGRAIWSVDKAVPPRRVRRLLRIDSKSSIEEDLDLVHYMPLLGDMLVESGVVLRQDVAEAVKSAQKNGRRLGEELLHRGALREDDLYRVLAQQRDLPFRRASEVLGCVDVELVRRLPRKFLDHYKFLPVAETETQVRVVTPDIDLPVWELQAVFDGFDVVPELVTPTDLERLWTAVELGIVDLQSRAPVAITDVGRSAVADVAQGGPRADAQAAERFEAIVGDAVAERASDVHFECFEDGTRLRFRIDGTLRSIGGFPMTGEDYVALIAAIKAMAGLDVAERRAPQSGRVQHRIADHGFELRVQTQPTSLHEGAVVHIRSQGRRPMTIEELGCGQQVVESYRRWLQEPQGLVLVVGAAGSGRSTTVYAGLQLLAQDPSRKTVTIEDPIEFALTGVQQAEVDAAVGYHFADAVRTFVRQDPDVIVIGEIGCAETAVEAVRAARLGNLVLAAMGGRDAVGAVQRLSDFGLPANAIAGELTGVLAQRLARRICADCRELAEPDAEVARELFPNGMPAEFRCFEGKGCDVCGGTGLRGRVAVVELLQIEPELRRAIGRGAAFEDLRRLAHACGMLPLRSSALQLVQDGVISMSELDCVLSADQMRPFA